MESFEEAVRKHSLRVVRKIPTQDIDSEVPTLFAEIRQPKYSIVNYILIPFDILQKIESIFLFGYFRKDYMINRFSKIVFQFPKLQNIILAF